MIIFPPRLNHFLSVAVLCSVLTVFSQSCDELPTRFVAPIFDVGVTVPLVDSLVTLDQMVQDSALLRKDGLGNLILVQRAALIETKIGDSLKLRPITVNYSSTIQEQTQILERVSFGYTTNLPLKTFFPSLPQPPSTTIIPALGSTIGNSFESPILSPNEAEYASFRKATIQVIVRNNFPIDMEVGILPGQILPGFVISTPGQKDIFMPLTVLQKTIPRSQTRGDSLSTGGAITLQILDQMLTQDSRIKGVVTSLGSNGKQISYDSTNILQVNVRIHNTTIRQAKLAISKQPLRFLVSTPLMDGATLTEAELLDFQTTLQMTNNFPVSGLATIHLPQLHRATDGREFSQQLSIKKNQNTPISLSSGGYAYRITPDSIDKADNNSTIKDLHVFIDVLTDAIPSTSMEIFDESNNFKLAGIINSLQLKYAAGTSLPQTNITFSSKVDFKPQGNIDKISFNRLQAKDSYLEMRLLNTAGVEAHFSGKASLLDASDNVITTVSIPLQTIRSATITGKTTIPYETILSIPLGSLDIPEFPKFAKIEATVTTTPNTPFLVNNTDYFSGTAEVRIPLTINIAGGNFHNMNVINISSEIRDRQKNMSSALITFEAKNRIPANVSCGIQFYDGAGNVILKVPKESPVYLGTAHSGTDGIADAETKTTFSLKIDSSDVVQILASSRYSFDFNFDANNASSNPYIKFLTSDYIHVRAMLEFKGNTDVR
ncbi:MAG: hypothetical protein HYZ54_05010 [Ignavibacteriae bacterium]|nr:hypothetical protein [Ignavibacteriota bacterium]